MKIVFLCRLFYPHIGGVEKHVMEVSQRLIKKGHEVTVITEMPIGVSNKNRLPHFEKSELATTESVNGIKIYRISVGRDDRLKKFRIWKEMWRLQRVIRSA